MRAEIHQRIWRSAGKITNAANTDYSSKDFHKKGEGTLVLTSAATVDDGITIYIHEGTVKREGTSDNAYQLSGGTLELTSGTHIGNEDGSSTNKITLANDDNGTTTNSTIKGNGAAIFNDVTGTGNLTLSNSANVYAGMDFTGNLTVASGSYNFGYSGNYGVSPKIANTGDITIDSGANVTLSYHGDTKAEISNTGNITVGGSLTVDKGTVKNGGDITVNGTLVVNTGGTMNNGGSITVTGEGSSLRLEGSGNIANAAQTISIADAGKLVVAADDELTGISLDGGRVELSNITLSGAVAVTTKGGVISSDSYQGSTVASAVTGAGSLELTTNNPDNTLRVQGNVANSGDVTISGKVEVMKNGDNVGSIANGGNVTVNSSLTVKEGASLNLSANSEGKGKVTVNENASLSVDSDATFSAKELLVSGGAVEANATMKLDAMTVSAGSVQVNSGIDSTNGATISVAEGATLALAGSEMDILSLEFAAGAKLTLSSGKLSFTASEATQLSFNTTVSDPTPVSALESYDLGLLTTNATQQYTILDLSGWGTEVQESLAAGNTVTLFENVSASNWTDTTVQVDFGTGTELALYDLKFVEAANGATSGSVQLSAPRAIPEPATATLSLLALSALAARRRRRA